jgi:hypothetical protein
VLVEYPRHPTGASDTGDDTKGIPLMTPRKRLLQQSVHVIQDNQVTHVLCTLWSVVSTSADTTVQSLKVVALGGEPIPKRIVRELAKIDCDSVPPMA